MKPTVTSYWVWLALAVVVVAAIVLAFIFLGRIGLSFSLAACLCVTILWLAMSASHRAVPESQCPVCRYSLKGLRGSICPECGWDVRGNRLQGRAPRGTRGLLKAACLAFVAANVIVFASGFVSLGIWRQVTKVMEWPTEFARGGGDIEYSIGAFGPEYGEPPGKRWGTYSANERLLVRMTFNSYPNHRDEEITATISAKLGARSALPQREEDPIVAPAWTGEITGFLRPGRKGQLTTTSALDVDSLVDAVFDSRLAHKDPLDETFRAILSDPAARDSLKGILAEGWASGRSTCIWSDSGYDRASKLGSLDLSRIPGVRFNGRTGALVGSAGSGPLIPAAITGIWVTNALGWLLAAFVVAAIMRWYGRPLPKRGELMPVRMRATGRYFIRSCGDAALTFVGGLRSDQPTCRGCGHPVTGLTGSTCPECGCSLASGVVKAGGMRPEKRGLSGALLLGASVISGLVAVGALMEGALLAVLVLPIVGVLFYVAWRLLRTDRSIEPFTPSTHKERRDERRGNA